MGKWARPPQWDRFATAKALPMLKACRRQLWEHSLRHPKCCPCSTGPGTNMRSGQYRFLASLSWACASVAMCPFAHELLTTAFYGKFGGHSITNLDVFDKTESCLPGPPQHCPRP